MAKRNVIKYDMDVKPMFNFENKKVEGKTTRVDNIDLPIVVCNNEEVGYAGIRVLSKEELLHKYELNKRTYWEIPYKSPYSFKVGEKVIIGNLIEPTIEEVINNGEAYLVRYIKRENNYGHPYIVESRDVWEWHRIRPLKSNKTETVFTSKEDNYMYFNQSSIESLLHTYYSFGINLYPEYQRDYVWDEEDKEKLLDSIFSGVSIGNFIVGKTRHKNYDYETEHGCYEAIDGKQRIKTLVDFYENRFKYKGYYFHELSATDFRVFMGTRIGVAQPEIFSDKQAVEIFLKFNTTGKPVDKETLAFAEKYLKELANE